MTEFSEDRQPKERKPRGKGKVNMMLEAIQSVCGSEQEYFRKLVDASIGDPLAEKPIPPNPQLMTLVVQRILPGLKTVAPLYTFDFPETGTAVEQAQALQKAMSDGILPHDAVTDILRGIESMTTIYESTVLRNDLEEIKKSLGID